MMTRVLLSSSIKWVNHFIWIYLNLGGSGITAGWWARTLGFSMWLPESPPERGRAGAWGAWFSRQAHMSCQQSICCAAVERSFEKNKKQTKKTTNIKEKTFWHHLSQSQRKYAVISHDFSRLYASWGLRFPEALSFSFTSAIHLCFYLHWHCFSAYS